MFCCSPLTTGPPRNPILYIVTRPVVLLQKLQKLESYVATNLAAYRKDIARLRHGGGPSLGPLAAAAVGAGAGRAG